MKHFLFAAAATLIAATGAQATIALQSIPDLGASAAGPAVAGPTAVADSATFAPAAETLLSQDALTLYDNISSVGRAPASYSFNAASSGSSVGTSVSAVFDPASSATLPEPTSWLLAAGGFCALAAFSGRASKRDPRSRLYVPEVAMVIAANDRRPN